MTTVEEHAIVTAAVEFALEHELDPAPLLFVLAVCARWSCEVGSEQTTDKIDEHVYVH
jgi:hypothetical protein